MATEVDTAFAQGQTAWPGLRCAKTAFAQVAAIWQGRLSKPLAEANCRDLFIAAALLDGDAAAIAAWEQAYLLPTKSSLRKLKLSPAAVDDVLQIVREKMLIAAPGGTPKLATLVGEGALESLLRVIVVRAALNFQRDQKINHHDTRSEDDVVLDSLTAADASPPAQLAKHETRQLLRELMSAAMLRLEKRDRTLLRLHFVHRMSIDELGALYDVHRATAARWLSRICDQLGSAVRTDAKARLQTRTDHIDSLLAELEHGLSTGFWATGSGPSSAT